MNHWQRIEAAINGEKTDRVPVSLWRHFPVDDLDAGKLAEHTIRWQKKWDFDLVKFMPSGTYGVEDWGAVTAFDGASNGARVVLKPAVNRVEDWANLTYIDARKGFYGQQNEALRMAAAELRGTVPILQTVFSPLTTARKLSSDRVFADLRRAPEILEAALRVITDVTIDFALGAIDAGAHGLFFATQLASSRLLTVGEYERFGRRYDLEVLAALRGKARMNMLHAHGDDIMFDMLTEYPVEMFNWHDRLTEPTLAEAGVKFPKLLVGGLNERDTMLAGSAEDIAAEVHGAIAQTGGRRLMIGPGCVLPLSATDASIRAVIDAAYHYDGELQSHCVI